MPASPPFRERLDAGLVALRRILGMPNYGEYVRHLRAHHPEQAIPTEREFFQLFLRTQYGHGGLRCC